MFILVNLVLNLLNLEVSNLNLFILDHLVNHLIYLTILNQHQLILNFMLKHFDVNLVLNFNLQLVLSNLILSPLLLDFKLLEIHFNLT